MTIHHSSLVATILLAGLSALTSCGRGIQADQSEAGAEPPVELLPGSPAKKDDRERLARKIAALLAEPPEQGAGWDRRVVLVELRGLADDLHLLQKANSGRKVPPTRLIFDDSALATADLEMMRKVEARLVEDAALGLEVENLLRTYDLMDCESLDGLLRSWLLAE